VVADFIALAVTSSSFVPDDRDAENSQVHDEKYALERRLARIYHSGAILSCLPLHSTDECSRDKVDETLLAISVCS